MNLSEYQKSKFDHADFNTSYENADSKDTISANFLAPALKHCKEFNRLTYSFTSSALKGWAGAFSNIVNDDVKIRITCDMGWMQKNADEQLKIALGNKVDAKKRDKILREELYKVQLKAFEFDNNPANRGARAQLLDWMIATERLIITFACPKNMKPTDDHSPLAHKKIGYFVFPDNSVCGFRGSWNETDSGSHHNDEDVSVFSSNKPEAAQWLQDIVGSVDRYLKQESNKFDFMGINKEILNMIQDRAPRDKPIIDKSLETSNKSSPESINEETLNNAVEIKLRDYQEDTLLDWNKNNRRGLVRHATGSGKTVTAISAIKQHLKSHQSCLIIVPSDLLQKQWMLEIEKFIPSARNKILNVGGGSTNWKKILRNFSKPDSTKNPKIILAVQNSASSDEFISKIYQGDQLMLVADEVHSLGSKTFSKVFNIQSGPRLGLSATPERFNDPIGTQKIIDYFGAELSPRIELSDVIGKALVNYDYFPKRCSLTEKELDDWDEISKKIRSMSWKNKKDQRGFTVFDKQVQLLLFQRAKIAKQASIKVRLACDILIEHFNSGEQWLVYCDDLNQIDVLRQELNTNNLNSMMYHSDMSNEAKDQTLENFKINGGILLSIKCLDEGIDIPSITHALIIASDQNPRQFIQRRGRVLRKDPNNPNKTKAFLYDLIVAQDTRDIDSIKNLAISELKRSLEFSQSSSNKIASEAIIRDMARIAKLDINEIDSANIEDGIDVEDEDL